MPPSRIRSTPPRARGGSCAAEPEDELALVEAAEPEVRDESVDIVDVVDDLLAQPSDAEEPAQKR